MISANQFCDLVAEYLRGVIDLDAFSSRFAVMFDDVEDSNDVAAIQLAYQIESRLADVSAGVASEAELREALIPCLIHVADVAVAPDYQDKETPIKKQQAQAESPYASSEAVFA